MPKPFKLAIAGCGLKAREYAAMWFDRPDVVIAAVADVDAKALDALAGLAHLAGADSPRSFDNTPAMLASTGGQLDAVYVSTPHIFHIEDSLSVVEAGLDLLLEKPMVTTAHDARRLEAAVHTANINLVVAYQAGLSPLYQDTIQRAERGEYGDLVSISATIWEGWADHYAGGWKQDPEISGGGFMLDTGAHMMNAVRMISGSRFACVSAYMNTRGRPVDVVCTVAAQLANGTLVTMHANGDGPPVGESQLMLFYREAVVTIDAWGRWREVHGPPQQRVREEVAAIDPLNVLVDVRNGNKDNPSSVGDGVANALLWEAIKTSARLKGLPQIVDA